MKFAVTILGSGSAKPTVERLPSAHVLNVHEHFFLIDCGEGTQISMLKYGISASKIDHIFISHLHGDHYFGLIGLLNTLHLTGRTRMLNLYCFPELREIIDVQLRASATTLSFQINYIYLNLTGVEMILDNKCVSVLSFPLTHRISTCGFLFREKKHSRNIRKDFVSNHNIPLEWFPRILSGEDYIDEQGNSYPNSSIVLRPGKSRSYAYCSDTSYDESLCPVLYGVSLLYHEASFADEHEAIAKLKFHSTARQAAHIAKTSDAGALIIGHFSSRYKDVTVLLEQAREVFENTIVAEDGMTYNVLV